MTRCSKGRLSTFFSGYPKYTTVFQPSLVDDVHVAQDREDAPEARVKQEARKTVCVGQNVVWI